MIRSRRRAREGALRALYEIELGKTPITQAIESTVLEMGISHDLADYMERLTRGVASNRRALDAMLERYLKEYDLSRLAIVDKNVLRVAAYELVHVPELPPAVTINEAIEISRKYSTIESGRFVNGVLGSLLKDTPKANWDPATAPREFAETPEPEPEPEIIEETVHEDSPEAKEARRFGWVIRSEPTGVPSIPDVSENP